MKRTFERFKFIKSKRKALLMLVDMLLVVFTYVAADVLFSVTSSRVSLEFRQKIIFVCVLVLSLLIFRVLLRIY